MKDIISRKNVGSILLAISLSSTYLVGSGQELNTAQKVIQRFIDVSGGEKLLRSIKSTEATAKSLMAEDSTLITVLKVVPFKIYMKIETTHNRTIEIAYNNGKARLKKDGQILPIPDSSGFEDLRLNSFVLNDLGYEALGYKMELLPSEEDSTYKIKLVSPEGKVTTKYYSKNTGYLTKSILPQGPIGLFSEYRNFDGFIMSRKEHTINEKGVVEDFMIFKFSLNPKFDPMVFDF